MKQFSFSVFYIFLLIILRCFFLLTKELNYFQLSQHKWAWPFMEPVDVEGLGLHDYYEVTFLVLFGHMLVAFVECTEGF